jgi:hypothetical protein
MKFNLVVSTLYSIQLSIKILIAEILSVLSLVSNDLQFFSGSEDLRFDLYETTQITPLTSCTVFLCLSCTVTTCFGHKSCPCFGRYKFGPRVQRILPRVRKWHEVKGKGKGHPRTDHEGPQGE